MNTEFKGTPAPWSEMANETSYITIGTEDRPWLFEVKGEHLYALSKEEMAANALLISKAPEMLDLLIAITEANPNDGKWDYQACMDKARQLVKSATELIQ